MPANHLVIAVITVRISKKIHSLDCRIQIKIYRFEARIRFYVREQLFYLNDASNNSVRLILFSQFRSTDINNVVIDDDLSYWNFHVKISSFDINNRSFFYG